MLLHNHAGYLTGSSKIFVTDAGKEGDTFELFTIDETVTWKPVFTGTLVKEGEVCKGDFSSLQTPGDYQICVGENISRNFVIKDAPYAVLERMLTLFYTWQRCGSKKGWAGLCHQELDNLYGTGRKLDMRGGYHQSGDLRCWHDGCSSAVYNYLRYAEEEKPLWEDGIFAEEIRWGVDYFRKTVSPEGFIYDCQFVPLGWGPRDYYNSPAPITDHCNIISLLARSSTYFRESDPAYAEENLLLAEKVWNFVEKSDFFDTPYIPPVPELPRGTQDARFYWQNRKNCTGVNCSLATAAYELYLATGKKEYLTRVEENLKKVMACQIKEGEASGIFRDTLENEKRAFQDCSYGYLHSEMVFLADLIRKESSSPYREEWKATLERYCDMLVREYKFITLAGMLPAPVGKNFRDDLPEAPAFTDSPIPLVHHQGGGAATGGKYAYILQSAYEIFGKEKYKLYAQRSLDFLLGFNPFEISFVTGIGYNHAKISVFGQFFPSTPMIPGGVTHLRGGEYDLPAAGILLRALTKFRK